ncbi:hypothetical protein [Chitinophaga niabensis]|uniref:Uncharacterized protein n=1 Tax=Chitinophaga niabensis TaxID=536979 RepID=A0A1N6JEB6_9BACT|nr:hypothetical protein [Chitinophaga niabensis]SIO42682.1 hypothetical protein SAMN04488055_3925 [Chitinophaga niabensis]
MELHTIIRPLHTDEIATLKKLKKEATKKLKSKKIIHYLIALLIGIATTSIAMYLKAYDLAVFVFGTIAVFAYGYVIFVPYEIYKLNRETKKKLKRIDDFLESNALKVIPVNALRIAHAKEYEDEGDLYIIEYKPDHLLYFNDLDGERSFPCLSFEIYEEDYSWLTWQHIRALSKEIEPVLISGKAKWAYGKEHGLPEHLATEVRSFEEVMEDFASINK